MAAKKGSQDTESVIKNKSGGYFGAKTSHSGDLRGATAWVFCYNTR